MKRSRTGFIGVDRAYDEAALERFGKDAILSFPQKEATE
jgi:hypothetical protein